MRKNKLLKIFIAIVLLISIESSVIAASTGVVNVDTVRVREEATTDSDIVELVSIGDKITITGEEGNWYKVKVGKVTGYIRKDLLTVDGKSTDSEGSNNDDTTGTATGNNNSGDEPTTPTEEPNANGGTSGETTTGNTSGEQPSENTTVRNNDKTISTIKIAEGAYVGQKVQLTTETKIKILPSANSSNIATLQANTEITVVEVVNSWCRIETEGTCGWVRID